jgi:hypothetical protein
MRKAYSRKRFPGQVQLRCPPEEIARIKADIKRLEKARDECADSGIRKQIEGWIE